MVEHLGQAYSGGELDLFALANNWKGYIKSSIAAYLRGDVLEVGAGIGATTVALHDDQVHSWVCLEPDASLAVRLRDRLRSRARPPAIHVVVGTVNTFADQPSFDCILYIDVLEHIEDDQRQIASAGRLVRPGGYVVVLSPAHGWLFSAFDKSIGHLRRYNKATLGKLKPEGFTEQKLTYLDSLGILLSLGNVIALRQSMPSEKQILAWDRLCLPISRRIDALLLGSVGKSILAVWRKQ